VAVFSITGAVLPGTRRLPAAGPVHTAFARAGGIVWQTSRLIGGSIGGAVPAHGGSKWRTPCYSTTRGTGTIRVAATPTITTLGPHGSRLTPFVHSTKPKNAEKDSLEISLRMADWLALHARRQTHDR
jgi:hypothetical protein